MLGTAVATKEKGPAAGGLWSCDHCPPSPEGYLDSYHVYMLSEAILCFVKLLRSSSIVQSAMAFFEFARFAPTSPSLFRTALSTDDCSLSTRDDLQSHRVFHSGKHAIAYASVLFVRCFFALSNRERNSSPSASRLLSEHGLLAMLWIAESFLDTRKSSSTLVLGQYTRHLAGFDQSRAEWMRRSWPERFSELRRDVVSAQRGVLEATGWNVMVEQQEFERAHRVLFDGNSLHNVVMNQLAERVNVYCVKYSRAKLLWQEIPAQQCCHQEDEKQKSQGILLVDSQRNQCGEKEMREGGVPYPS